MKRALLMVMLLAGAGGGLAWWLTHRHEPPREFALYGNVDLRQVQLAFNNSERIADVLVEEGARVPRGKLLAELDTSRLKPQVDQAAAQVAAQQAVVARLHRGSRPEEIAQARANVEAVKADAANARRQYKRLKELSAVRLEDRSKVQAVSQEELDNARAAKDVAEAKLMVNQEALALAIAGPRKEDIAEAEANLRAKQAQLALLKQQLADAKLRAPTDGIIRTRLLEPGDMASPQKPVFTLAVTQRKWVRAYVSEPDLGKVHQDQTAYITVDSFPDRRFEGWVGFISPVAEFTPKTVQTEELRTSLVYEVRIFVKDPADELRLGMPATVTLEKDKKDRQEKERR